MEPLKYRKYEADNTVDGGNVNNYKMLIQYDGGRYKGWQRLGNEENTIQGKIEKVLSQLVGENIEIVGCGRTDAGVHALAQVANFKIHKRLSETEISDYLNHYLPQDISIIKVDHVCDDFHARYHAKAKTYLYKIWNEPYTNPFIRKHSMHVEKKLNRISMQIAARYFIGEHDFTAFTNAKSKKKSMIRQVYSIVITVEAGLVEIRVRGNGFLYNMVRRMVGMLIEVGLGHIDAANIPEIINAKERNRAGFIAEPNGLYLESIEYDEIEIRE